MYPPLSSAAVCLAVVLLGVAAIVADEDKIDASRNNAVPNARWKRSHPGSTAGQNIKASRVPDSFDGSKIRQFSKLSPSRDSLSSTLVLDSHSSISGTDSVSTPQANNSPPSSLSHKEDTNSGNGQQQQQQQQQHQRMVKSKQHPNHHISRRSFDSIDIDSGLRGMGQNFFGNRLEMRSQEHNPYTYNFFPEWKREDNNAQDELPIYSALEHGEAAGLEDLGRLTLDEKDVDENRKDLDIVLSLLPLWYRWAAEKSAASDDLTETDLNNNFGDRDRIAVNNFKNTVSKRGFDSISRWRGGLSGLSQNFIGPKRGDFDSMRTNLDYGNMLYGFGTKKRANRQSAESDKRSFDSISNGFTSGFYQNHLGKKATSSRENRWWGHGLRRNHLAKRDFEKLGMGNNNMADKDDLLNKKKRFHSKHATVSSLGNIYMDNPTENKDAYRPSDVYMLGDDGEFAHKRSFDSISRGQLSGLGQNHLRKRAQGFTANGQVQPNKGQGFVSRRSFDSINDESELSGAFQNYVHKRNLETDPNTERDFALQQWKRFDSINFSPLGGMGQNFVSKKRSGSLSLPPKYYEAHKRTFDPISIGVLGGANQHFITKRSISSQTGRESGQHEKRTRSKRHFDSISRASSLSGFRQNFFSSKRPSDAGPPQYLTSGFTHSRDDFLDKRNFDSIARSRLSGLAQNHFSKKNFDSIDRGRVSGLRQNFIFKRNLDSIGNSRMGGLRQNFISKRNFDSFDDGQDWTLRQNSFDRRNFDSINDGRVGGFEQNFVSKRKFDSIGTRHLSGLRQNFISKRNFRTTQPRGPFMAKRYFDSIDTTGLGGLRQNFISKRSFDSLGNSQMGGFRQNFVSKRYFDSINDGGLDGMRQNFISKRLRYLSTSSPTRNHFGSWKSLKDLPGHVYLTGDTSSSSDDSHMTPLGVEFYTLDDTVSPFHTSDDSDKPRSGLQTSENNEGQVPVAQNSGNSRFYASNANPKSESGDEALADGISKILSKSDGHKTKASSPKSFAQRDTKGKDSDDSALTNNRKETR